jgi:hypothetical protein
MQQQRQWSAWSMADIKRVKADEACPTCGMPALLHRCDEWVDGRDTILCPPPPTSPQQEAMWFAMARRLDVPAPFPPAERTILQPMYGNQKDPWNQERTREEARAVRDYAAKMRREAAEQRPRIVSNDPLSWFDRRRGVPAPRSPAVPRVKPSPHDVPLKAKRCYRRGDDDE